MAVLRSKREIAKSEFQSTMCNLYDYSLNRTKDIAKRRKKWLSANIDAIMNRAYSEVMSSSTMYFETKEQREECVRKSATEAMYILYSLQKPLLVMWNIEHYDYDDMIEWANFIRKEQSLLLKTAGKEEHPVKLVVLDWNLIDRVNFLHNMSELHRYTHCKVANAEIKYDETQGKMLIECVNDAFYHVMVANAKVPTTKKEYEKRKAHISKGIDSLRHMNKPLLFYFNLMHYSEETMEEWSDMLEQELKMLYSIQRSDHNRFSKLK